MPGVRTAAASAPEGVRRASPARSILSKAGGYLAEAGFTHSLTPARNCTFGCTYCYVPTMGIYGGLKPEDWRRWGQFTTFKSNAADLVARESRPDQVIYCSPLVDPYQPAEEAETSMPGILDALIERPPGVFVIQTRGPLVARDLSRLVTLSTRTTLRVSFSLTTNRDDIRRLYEPLCAPFEERLSALRTLRMAGIETYATLAPLLPCDPEELAARAIDATGRDLIGDPLHVRSVKPRGATTRPAAERIAAIHGHEDWFDPSFQDDVVRRIRGAARSAGKEFTIGPAGFGLLTRLDYEARP
ncbi:MAG: radical SAM protein [Bryobacteraceae bacterium]